MMIRKIIITVFLAIFLFSSSALLVSKVFAFGYTNQAYDDSASTQHPDDPLTCVSGDNSQNPALNECDGLEGQTNTVYTIDEEGSVHEEKRKVNDRQCLDGSELD